MIWSLGSFAWSFTSTVYTFVFGKPKNPTAKNSLKKKSQKFLKHKKLAHRDKQLLAL
jgi:hypothetical protein